MNVFYFHWLVTTDWIAMRFQYEYTPFKYLLEYVIIQSIAIMQLIAQLKQSHSPSAEKN